MPNEACPGCGAMEAHFLDVDSWVDYFRCPKCGVVWTLPRDARTDKLAVMVSHIAPRRHGSSEGHRHESAD
jgi:hypothetical protein